MYKSIVFYILLISLTTYSRVSYAQINESENKYIAKRYITTKVGLNIEESDFDKGKISLFILQKNKEEQ